MTGLLLIALLAAPAGPDPLAGPAPVTVAAVLAYARDHAPALRAAAASTAAARHAADGAAPWPEPRLMIGVDPLPIATRNGPAWGRATLTQPLPWLDALDADRAAASASAREMGEAERLAALDVEEAALRAFHGLAAARAEGEVITTLHANALELLRTAEERLGVARARHADVIDARIEVARLETVIVDVAQVALTRQAELNAAIGRPAQAPIGPLAPPDAAPTERLDALLAAAAEHPALARAEARLAANRARLRAAETTGRPMLSVGLGYTLIGQPDDPMGNPDAGRDALSVQVGLSLPLWGGAAYAADRDAAAAAARAEQAHSDAVADAVQLRVVEQAVQAETALRRLRLYRETAIPLSDQRREVLLAAYAAGEVDFDRVLAAERMGERYAIEAVRAAAEFEMARAALARAVGRSPLEAPPSDEEAGR